MPLRRARSPLLAFERGFTHVFRCRKVATRLCCPSNVIRRPRLVGIRRVRTVETGEALSIPVCFEGTTKFRALLAGVGRLDCLNNDTVFVGFVRDLFLQRTEGPLLEFLAVADALSNLL